MRVRYYAHIAHPTGYGRAAVDLAFALLSAGCELEISAPAEGARPTEAALPLAPYVRAEADLSPNPDVVIVHTLPKHCAVTLERAGFVRWDADSQLRQVRTCSPAQVLVAYTTWEGAGPIPDDMAASLSIFDQIWVPSRANERSMRGFVNQSTRLGTKIGVVPHSFDETSVPRRKSLDVKNDLFRFYYIGAWNGRKNPVGLIRAYARAFNRSDRVVLGLQCSGTPKDAFVMASHTTGLTVDELPRMVFSGEFVDDASIEHIHASADCFVTATRGEAWNLPAFEAVIAGRQVISTKGIGSDDFLDDTSALMIHGTRSPAVMDIRVADKQPGDGPKGTMLIQYIGAQGLTCKHDWIEPDLNHLARGMRRVYDGRIRDLDVHYDLAHDFGRKEVGLLARNYLEH